MNQTIYKVHRGWLVVSFIYIDKPGYESAAAAAVHSIFIEDPTHSMKPEELETT